MIEKKKQVNKGRSSLIMKFSREVTLLLLIKSANAQSRNTYKVYSADDHSCNGVFSTEWNTYEPIEDTGRLLTVDSVGYSRSTRSCHSNGNEAIFVEACKNEECTQVFNDGQTFLTGSQPIGNDCKYHYSTMEERVTFYYKVESYESEHCKVPENHKAFDIMLYSDTDCINEDGRNNHEVHTLRQNEFCAIDSTGIASKLRVSCTDENVASSIESTVCHDVNCRYCDTGMSVTLIDPLLEGACSRIEMAGEFKSLYTNEMSIDFCEEIIDSSSADNAPCIKLYMVAMITLSALITML
jgi:hypothetical protein